ncbi:RNA-directed DNA polymerase, eukaryota, reverse transcriptase zinc-binding domain protein [Tanacetum coccineum]
MSSGRVCISTRSHYRISEKVNVEVHGELFDVHVHELGTWSTSITDNSLDTFSNVDVNDINKVEDVVEENPIDDLNDLNDNLNDLAQELKEDEVHEDDLNVNFQDQIQVPLKEEIHVPTFSNGETSNPSRPPGFEHMKRSPSYTSKVQETKMTHLELFHLKSMWGNFKFDYACIMALGRSGGLVSVWEPNMFVKEAIWCDEAFIIVKEHWNNSVDLPIEGRLYTWMNKAGTNLSKLGRFLISKDVLESTPDIRITALERLWSDHTPILLHVNVKNNDRSQKQKAILDLKSIDKKIDDGTTT